MAATDDREENAYKIACKHIEKKLNDRFTQTIFQFHYVVWKLLYDCSNFNEICSHVFD